MYWEEKLQEVVKESTKQGVPPLIYFLVKRVEWDHPEQIPDSDDPALVEAWISQIFFDYLAQGFAPDKLIYQGMLSPEPILYYEQAQGVLGFYLTLCVPNQKSEQEKRDSFAELIQYGNAAEIKPLIYDELKRLKTQLCNVSRINATRNQVLGIKETLKRIVDLAGTYDAQASSN